MDANQTEIIVEVAYALPNEQLIIPIKVSNGTTIEQAIKASGILAKFTEIDLAVNKVGVFGKLAKLDMPLRHLDRVEIYRSLIADPKEVRKQRVADGKVMKKGGGDSHSEV
ncbi:persistence and stress-resistance antitoxin PasI [mine drainage metagenome]|uniref:Persistence and stress-resistance antitoxin PasI n=1 Tax=mine drainage metagenome TaxID=410659 RepID=A0A1J5TMX0_9ZZZZ